MEKELVKYSEAGTHVLSLPEEFLGIHIITL